MLPRREALATSDVASGCKPTTQQVQADRSAAGSVVGLKASNTRIRVHVRERTFVVSCGDAGQRISWLANVGIVRYDDRTKGMELGVPRGVRLEDGTLLDMDDVICSRLVDGSDVWVLLKEDLIYGDAESQGEAQSKARPGTR
mmetsp:Transcript_41663/g.117776  ORF Transcript_41663/g.117776 Transcript_41663/m.117776 type:complete len:143 (-) Transcript_41663:238-666(-)